MYKYVFINNHDMYRWPGYQYVSMCAIGFLVYCWMTAHCIVMCICCASIQTQMHLCPLTHDTISLHPSPYNIARCGFAWNMLCYLLMLCLWLFVLVTDMSLCLCLVFPLATIVLLLHGDIFVLGEVRYMQCWCEHVCLMLLCPNNNKVFLSFLCIFPIF